VYPDPEVSAAEAIDTEPETPELAVETPEANTKLPPVEVLEAPALKLISLPAPLPLFPTERMIAPLLV